EAGGSVTGITSGLDSYAYLLHAERAQALSLDADATRNAALVVPLENGKARIDQVKALPAQVQGDAIVVVAGITTKKTDAPYTLRAEALVAGEGDAASEGAGATGASDSASSSSASGCAAARRGMSEG